MPSAVRWAIECAAVILLLCAGVGCHPAPTGNKPHVVDQNRDRLEPISLTDQHGRALLLSSLKGRFVLFDFIYTTCPGPCLLTTARMAGVARHLGDGVGSRITLVSVTVDPAHDGPAQLLDYAKRQGAERPGWLFLTGTPDQIGAVMKDFNLPLQRQPDGVIDHIIYFFLIGPDGREQAMYDPIRATPDAIARAVTAAMERAAKQVGRGRGGVRGAASERG